MIFRKATENDIKSIANIYEAIHDGEELGRTIIGWIRGVYPTEETARAGVLRGDMFVCEDAGNIVAAAVINQTQVDCYADGKWADNPPDDQVMVLHTLVVSPAAGGKGVGTEFVRFYEDFARKNGALYLRMDTNARNTAARTLYKKLGYSEPDIVPCIFNGIPGVELVLLEKKLAE